MSKLLTFARRSALIGFATGASLVLSAGGPGSESPVADAVMRGDSVALRLMIKQGMDVNAAQADGMTALHWASTRGDASAARMLLYAGARVDAVTRNGNYTPLHLAAKAGKAEATNALLAAGADVKAATSTGGATALHFASSNGDSSTVAALVGKGAPVNARETAWSQTPLMWAAAANSVGAIQVLAKNGADLEAVSKVEDMAARERADRAALAARSRRLAALKAAEGPVLPPAGAGPGGGRGAGAAPVGATAAPAGAAAAPAASAAAPAAPKPEAKKAEVKKPEAKPEAKPAAAGTAARPAMPAGGTAAPAAAPSSDSARLAAARNRGASYGEQIGGKGGLTALLFAVREGHTAAANALLMAGAQINHVSDGDHTSPLLMATINGHFDLAKTLLDRGADVKLASDAGATPLYSVINVYWAAKSLYPQPVAQQQQKITHLELMEALLKAGADVNARLKKHLWYMEYNFGLLGVSTIGATPFWRAAYGTDVEAMKLLVKYGADVTLATIKPAGRLLGEDAATADEAGGAKDPSGLPPVPDGGPGVPPLHAAAGVGYGEGFAANSHRHAPDGWIPSLKYMIEELKMDVNSRDYNGYTALHHAAARGDNETIKYLMSKGADITVVSRRGQTVADMANGPVSRIVPFPETVELLVKLGSKNNNSCKSC